MANGYMVVNSKFKPLSYEEMLRPIAAYTDEYNAQEAAYDELANQAAQWEKLKNSEIDQDTYQQYKSYTDELQKAAETLASEGLKPGGRRALQEIRRKYTKDVVPIEQAYQKRTELSKLQKELRAKDPTTLLERGADEIALSELIANPELSPATYSGAYLENSARQTAAALAKSMRDDPKRWRSILGGQYYEARMKTGYTADEIQRAIAGDPSAPEELTQVISQVTQPISNWANPQTLDEARNYVTRGLWGAIGDNKYQMAENWRDKLQASQRSQMAMESHKANLAGAAAAAESTLFPGGSFKLASPSETVESILETKKRLSGVLNTGKIITPRLVGIPLTQPTLTAGSTSMVMPVRRDTISIFDNNGKLRNRESVIKSGKTNGQRLAISEMYDKIIDDLQYLGIDNTKDITSDEIKQVVEQATYENSPTAHNFERVPIDPQETSTLVGNLLAEAVGPDEETLQGIKKIESWDKNGIPKFSSSPVKKEDVLNEDKNGKITTKSSPIIGASRNPNLKGQILVIDGSTYLVEPEGFRGRTGAKELATRQAELIAAEEEFKRENTERAYRALELARANYRRAQTLPYKVSVADSKFKALKTN